MEPCTGSSTSSCITAPSFGVPRYVGSGRRAELRGDPALERRQGLPAGDCDHGCAHRRLTLAPARLSGSGRACLRRRSGSADVQGNDRRSLQSDRPSHPCMSRRRFPAAGRPRRRPAGPAPGLQRDLHPDPQLVTRAQKSKSTSIPLDDRKHVFPPGNPVRIAAATGSIRRSGHWIKPARSQTAGPKGHCYTCPTCM